uniref:YqeY-like protein n=1 Tax=Siphoviridae sp. ctrpg19 TaxID=2826481 RepID=A0A8S5ML41_9CAUD|nr:MAG TPA: YqeY-like protein [Siphoviridae sp. ctrpg19]
MLKDIINEKWKERYKEKDVLGKSVFESIKAKIMTAEKSGKYTLPLEDSVVESLVVKESKELSETRDFYRVDSKEYEEFTYKMNLLEEFLPKQLSEEGVVEIVKKLAVNEKNMGKLIKQTIDAVGNSFDKSKIAGIVKSVL